MRAWLCAAVLLAACVPNASEAPSPEAYAACEAAAEAVASADEAGDCDWSGLADAAPAGSMAGYYLTAQPGAQGVLAVAPRADGDLAVGVSIVFADSLHDCSAVFDGRIEEGGLALTPVEAPMSADQLCVARLERGAEPGRVVMRSSGNCSQFCGARATFDATEYALSRR